MISFPTASKKTLLSLFLLLILVGGIILTVIQVQKQQETRQRAQTPTSCQVIQSKCSWSPVTDANQYRVSIIEVSSGTTIIDQVTMATQVLFPVQPGKTYKCTVFAQNFCGTGLPGVGFATCPAPTTTPAPITPVPAVYVPPPTALPTPTPTPSPTPTPTPTVYIPSPTAYIPPPTAYVPPPIAYVPPPTVYVPPPTALPTAAPTIAPTGAEDTVLKIGMLSIIISILGGLLLLGL